MKDGDSNEGGRVGDGRREATGERALTTMPGEESQGSVQTSIARKKKRGERYRKVWVAKVIWGF